MVTEEAEKPLPRACAAAVSAVGGRLGCELQPARTARPSNERPGWIPLASDRAPTGPIAMQVACGLDTFLTLGTAAVAADRGLNHRNFQAPCCGVAPAAEMRTKASIPWPCGPLGRSTPLLAEL